MLSISYMNVPHTRYTDTMSHKSQGSLTHNIDLL